MDPECLGGKPPGLGVGIEPGTRTRRDHRKGRLPVSAKDNLTRSPVDIAVGQGYCLSANPLSVHHSDGAGSRDAQDLCAREKRFQSRLDLRRHAASLLLHFVPHLNCQAS